jgi:hypothetical protein
MHGNETTSLRGWMDLIHALGKGLIQDHFQELLNEFTIHYIPMLNPDGAEKYQRRNAAEIDMNRDARSVQSPEMKLLLQQIDSIKPEIALNLHDQRNIFHAGSKPATISFLAPSVDQEKSITSDRMKTMNLIAKAAERIQPYLSGGIGRYTDEYYPTAIGEYIQQKGISTILVECGPANNDPLRMEGRKINALILYSVLSEALIHSIPSSEGYFEIPLNESNQVDLLIKGVETSFNGSMLKADIALMEELIVSENDLLRRYKMIDFGDLRHLRGLEEYYWIKTNNRHPIKINEWANIDMETKEARLEISGGFIKSKKGTL